MSSESGVPYPAGLAEIGGKGDRERRRIEGRREEMGDIVGDNFYFCVAKRESRIMKIRGVYLEFVLLKKWTDPNEDENIENEEK